jgi:hypothetical protein
VLLAGSQLSVAVLSMPKCSTNAKPQRLVDHGVAVMQAGQAAPTSPYTVRTDDTLKVRFSATVGEEPEVEVALV